MDNVQRAASLSRQPNGAFDGIQLRFDGPRVEVIAYAGLALIQFFYARGIAS